MKIQMVISGVGGQGVLLATRIFTHVALKEGYPLIGSEDHGMSQRGGSVLSHVKIGAFESPLVRKGGADLVLSLEKNEAYKTLHFLKPGAGGSGGGLCFINAPDPLYMDSRVRAYLEEQGIEIHIFGADRVAEAMGATQSANIALIGFASAHPRFPFSSERVRMAVEAVTAERFREVSLKIFGQSQREGEKVLCA